VPRDKPEDVRDSLFENVREQLNLGITSVIEAGASVDPNVVGSYAEWELKSMAASSRGPRSRSDTHQRPDTRRRVQPG